LFFFCLRCRVEVVGFFERRRGGGGVVGLWGGGGGERFKEIK